MYTKLFLTTIRTAQDLIYDFDQEQFYNVSVILIVFLLGVLIGIKVFAKFLTWLLKLYPNNTIAVLIGLMIGSLYKIWPWQNLSSEKKNLIIKQTSPVLPQNFEGEDSQLINGILFMFFGFIIIFFLEKSKSVIKMNDISKTNIYLKNLLLILKGVAMGAANKVPGVSGGIIALIGGFYEELINSFQHFNSYSLKLVLKGDFKNFWAYVNGSFLSYLFFWSY